MVGSQISLAFHETGFHFPLEPVRTGVHVGEGVVYHGVTEVVQSQIRDALMVPWEMTDFLRLHHVIEHPVVGSSHQFNSVVHEMTVKFHQESHQGQVMWRDVVLQLWIVGVPE